MSKRRLSRFVRQALWTVFCLAILLSLRLSGATSTAYADGPTFDISYVFGSADSNAVAMGDFNGDGAIDIVVGNSNSGSSEQNRVYLNGGSGNFFSDTRFGNPLDSTYSVAVGDLNGDGTLDIVEGNWREQNVVRLNDGTGNFLSGTPFGGADNTYSVAAGDLNGDGTLDLVVGNNGEQNVVYLNDGSGVFSSGIPFGGADSTASVAVGDLNGDGTLDIVVGNDGQNLVYLNDGSGVFSSGIPFGGADGTYSVAVRDLDGDGTLDIIEGNWRSNEQNVVYLNDGSGDFSASIPFGGADYTKSVAAGDLNGDGTLDLVVGNNGEQNVVYLNDGSGVFSSGIPFGGADSTASVAVGDLNGDGALDIVVGNDGQNLAYQNDGVDAFPSDPGIPFGSADHTQSVAVGDLNGDGALDIVVGNGSSQTPLVEQNVVYLNDGSGNFSASIPFGGADATFNVAAGDLNGDGTLDLVVGNNGEQNVVYLNDGSGVFSSGIPFGGADNTASVAVGDLNGDGALDIVVGNSGQNYIYLNDGSGSFPSATPFGGSDATRSVAVGDLNSDGALDIVVGNHFQDYVYLNKGLGTFPSGIPLGDSSDRTESVAVGDLNGDGTLDIAMGYHNKQSRVYLNDGAGNFSSGAPFGNVSSAQSIAVGDLNGDGALDIVAGNRGSVGGGQNHVYLNDGSGNFPSDPSTAFGDSSDITYSIAVGDLNGDGTFDIVAGNSGGTVPFGQYNLVYLNNIRLATGLIDNAPYLAVTRPIPTGNANFYSSPVILDSPTIPVTYTLFDREGDPVRFIRAYYSPSGGGQWFPVTPSSGTITTNLTASPDGTSHTFTWQAEADVIKSDNVVFRIEAYQGFTGFPGPYQWPYFAAQTFPFRVAAPWYIRVVDDTGSPVAGTTVYANGQPITQTVTGASVTDRAGLLNPGPLAMGTTLAALAPRAEQPTVRDHHDGWAYRTHLTTQPFAVSGPGEQRLVARREDPLVLFNLIVSIEWDADVAYTQQISRAVRFASDYLHDISDGQMAFGYVHIYDDAEYWADADLQISTKNIVRPHAYIGGITSSDKSHVIRVGRFWDGNSGNQGPWDQRDGFRTLAHEFGHYAFHLYDEYFGYLFDENGDLIGEVPAYCTGPENRNPATDATNASVMDYQYTTSELSARNVPGLWSPLCEQTAQWQLNGESAWETLARKYADFLSPSRWQFTTPLNRGSVLAGPDSLRSDLPDWPLVEVHQEGPPPPLRRLTVYGPEGPYWGALVALYTNQGSYPVAIDQGFTDRLGRIDIYGAQPGDTLRAASFDGALSGSVSVTDATSYIITMGTSASLQALAVPGLNAHLTLRPSSDGGSLYLRLSGLGPGGTLVATVTQSGGSASRTTTLSYSSAEEAYVGSVTFSAPHTQLGTGTVQVVGAGVGSQGISLNSTYALQAIPRDQVTDLYSADGNLHIRLITDTLPVDAYAVLSPLSAPPTAPPEGWQIVGNVYDIRLSGALAELLEKPGILTLHYDGALVNSSSAPEGLGIYRWDPTSETWQAVAGSLDEEQRAMVASVTTLGMYALMAPPGEWEPSRVFLPIIPKDAP